MSEIVKERNEIDPKYKWDLTTLYKDDEAFENDLKSLDEVIAKAGSFSGKLNNVAGIKAYYDFSTETSRKLSDLFCYANLRHSEDIRDAKASSMYNRAYRKYVELISALSYVEPEILSLSEAELLIIAASDELADYRFSFTNLIRQKAHTLSAKEEYVLSSLQQALSTGSETADALLDADMTFASVKDSKGIEHELSGSSFIPLQMSLDRTLRKNAFHSYYASFKQHIHTFAATYSGCLQSATVQARLRNYSSSRAMAMDGDNISESVYDNLIATVHKHMDLMYRYVALRKKILKLDELHYYDVYAPLVNEDKKQYSYEEAKDMVVKAVSPLGDEYVNNVKKAYAEGWIDVYPNKGKSSGAFSSGTYDANPFILLNYVGNLDNVSTLAHEMGHSQHTYLTKTHQPPQYSDYSLFVAEVASTVNENLLIEQLLADCHESKERLSLLNQYLEGFKGTVYRQTMFAEFEKEAHAMMERGESLEADALCELYAGLIKEYFGEDLVIDEEVRYEWARIPHFYRPFYVYVYATGYTSAVALSEGILSGDQDKVKKYLEFLSMGGSAYPLDELKHGGVDLTTPEPIERALMKFAKVLDDAEKTYAELAHEA